MNTLDDAWAFVRKVENRLGWTPTNRFARKVTATKVAERMLENPDLYTPRNLALAVELLAREKQPRTPLGVLLHVARAVELAKEDDSDIEEQIRKALLVESQRGDPNGWITRFARAQGAWRKEALDEWRTEREKARNKARRKRARR